MRNHLTIDLEDWFCVSNFDALIQRSSWASCDFRVADSTRRLLELFDRRGVKATFFVLGWVAERDPALIREVAEAGHEIACHGYGHERLTQIDAPRFDADLGRALTVLRGLVDAPVVGYRAPSFSLTERTLWAIPILRKHGIRWDSSVFPFGGHPEYGVARAPLSPYPLADDLVELPLSWKKPRTIFVNSMSDLFHQAIPVEFIQRVFDVMRRANWHQYQVLTKRSQRLLDLDACLNWQPHIWMGVSVETQDYQFRIDHLRQTRAHTKFLSLEPLLGPLPHLDLTRIDWVIVGGESGPGARPMKPAWVTEIRDQCQAAGVPFFFKQWGGVHKVKNGRELEGRTWDEMPCIGETTTSGAVHFRRKTRCDKRSRSREIVPVR